MLTTRVITGAGEGQDEGPAADSIVSLWPGKHWTLYLTLSVLLGAYLGLNSYISLRAVPTIAPWEPFLWEMSSVLVICLLIPVIVRFEDHFRIDAHARMRVILAHAVMLLAFSTVHVLGIVLLRKAVYLLVGGRWDFGNVPIQGFFELQRDAITYVIVLVGVVALREFRRRRARELRAAQLSAELSEARLRHLTAQIEPHFLFNSLNAISNRMHEDVDAADRMISQLSDLLRASYESDHHVIVPLERELGWLRNYAAMMGERFRGQLTFEIGIEPGLETLQVPRLLLQPIVENALRHGLTDGRGWVQVDVRRDGRRLKYTVSDDGTGFPSTPVMRGTGISNISRRLELLFPGDHTLEFSTRQPHGAVVTVSFPVGFPVTA
jgi:two-component system, LytTR family, sensor kinase